MNQRPGNRRPSRVLTALAVVASLGVGAVAAAAQPSPATIVLRPACGPSGSAITVEGAQFNPFTAVLITFDAGIGGRPESFPAGTDGFGRFEVVIQPSVRPDGAHVVRADDFKRREATATFVIPCTSVPDTTTTSTSTPPVPSVPPSLTLEPPMAPPGFVTYAVGRGFAPHTPVELVWLVPGWGTVRVRDVTTGEDGGFREPVLVFHREPIGPRQMIATGVADPPTARASFLVVPATSQPSDFRNRR